jgi:plastocyanin
MTGKPPYLILGLGVLLIGALGLSVLHPGSSDGRDQVADLRHQEEAAIVLTEDGFIPRDILISPGTKVTFTSTRENQFWPASNTHPSHGIFPDFDPKRPLESDESWSFTFDRVGNWGYHDHIRSYFTGIIYVEKD